MANPEVFRPKSAEKLAQQVSGVSKILGESITQSSFHNESLGLPLETLKQRFPERYRIYLDTLRREKTGELLDSLAGQKLRILNNLDCYVTTHINGDAASRTLRDRQMTVFEDLRGFFESGGNEGYIKLPTAAGKTVLFTEFVEATRLRTLIVVPTKLLIEQTDRRFQEFAPNVEVGKVYSDAKEFDKEVTLTTYDSFIKRVKSGNFIPDDYDLLILDEAHKALSQRRRGIVGLFNRAIKLGFTATPKYAKNKELKELLVSEIHSMNIPEGVELGLLSPLSVYIAETDIDLSNIRIAADGDYDEGDLERAINITSRNLAAVDVYQQLFPGQKTVMYCVGVRHAEVLARHLNDRGIAADFISGYQTRVEQQERLERFRNGEINVLCNANILIEGFDEPSVVVCFNLRPTLSAVVAEQRGGRALRLDPNNPNKRAIIVDFIGKDYTAGDSPGKNPPITFTQIIERAEILKKVPIVNEGGATGEGTKLYPDIEISGIRVITSTEEVMRITRELSGITKNGWHSLHALSRRLRIDEEFLLKLIKPFRKMYAEYFEPRAYGDQQREYVSPEGLSILENCFEYGQGKKGVQEDEFPLSFTNLTHFKGRRQKVQAATESVLEELTKEDPASIKIRFAASNPVMVTNRARFIALMGKRGFEFRERNQTEEGKKPKGPVIDLENEIALTQSFLCDRFTGDYLRIHSISNEVLSDLAVEYPESHREGTNTGAENRRGSGRRITILKKEFEALYEQRMQAKGLELANRTVPIDRQLELGITNEYLNNIFVGGSAKNRPISVAVLAQIEQEHPGAWRQGVTSTKISERGERVLGKKIIVLKKEFEEIYKRMMTENGVELKETFTSTPIDPNQEIGITNQYNETIFIGNERTLRPISKAVLSEITEAYPQALRTTETPGRKTVIVLKREFETLYKQRMQRRGIRLR
ncbi:MAG: DEAD/DEAH box helicase family protein [Candidatus Levybacteria bacterium]|nr:DEAD/DEAH box helicase family protein [Candidatus Levybacteria bacterium]